MGSKRIANLHELTGGADRSQGTRYASKHALIAPTLGAVKLGYNLTEIPPGKAAFPYHFHHVNEEMFLILEGAGEVRMPDGTHALKAGDLLCCPPGPDGAHQIVNTGSAPLKYLALSTVQDPEVVEYPDAGKYGVMAGRKAGRPISEAAFHAFAFVKDRVDYWDGEET
jgi:uncharacterized cupin superfamily protein